MHRKSILYAMFPYAIFYFFAFILTLAIKATELTNPSFHDIGTDIMSIIYVLIVIVSPIYTSLVCHGLIKKGMINYFDSIAVLLISVLAGVGAIYFSWGFATSNLFNPDSESLLVIQFALALSVAIALISWSVMIILIRLSQ